MARRSVLLIVAVLIALVGHRPDRALRPRHRPARHRGPGDGRGAGRHRRHRAGRGRRPPPRRPASSRRREVRRDDLVEGALTSTSSITDLVALGTIYPGEQILATKFGSLGRRREPGHPGRQAGRLRRAHRPRARRRLRQPRLRGGDLRRPADPFSTSRTARRQSSPPYTRLAPAQGPGHRRRHDERRRPRRPRPRTGEETERSPRTILTVAVNQEEAEKLIYADPQRRRVVRPADRRHQDRPTSPASPPADIMPELLPERPVTTILEPDVGAARRS